MIKFKAALISLCGVTIYAVNRRNDAWRYASVRILTTGNIEVTAPGCSNWRRLTEVSRQAKLNAHQRFVVKLALHAVEVLLHGDPLAPGLTLCVPVLCSDGCGKLLTHPRSIESGQGPTCRGAVAAAQARTATKREAAASFVERMAARRMVRP